MDRINGSISTSIDFELGINSRIIYTDGAGERTGFDIDGFVAIEDQNDQYSPLTTVMEFSGSQRGLDSESMDERPDDVVKVFLNTAYDFEHNNFRKARFNAPTEVQRLSKRAVIFSALGGMTLSGGMVGLVQASEQATKGFWGAVAVVGVSSIAITGRFCREAMSRRVDRQFYTASELSKKITVLDIVSRDNAVFTESDIDSSGTVTHRTIPGGVGMMS